MKVGLDAVSDKGRHCDTSVLDFRVTQPSDRLLVGKSPKLSFSQSSGIKELDKGVQVLCENLEVGLEYEKKKKNDNACEKPGEFGRDGKNHHQGTTHDESTLTLVS